MCILLLELKNCKIESVSNILTNIAVWYHWISCHRHIQLYGWYRLLIVYLLNYI